MTDKDFTSISSLPGDVRKAAEHEKDVMRKGGAQTVAIFTSSPIKDSISLLLSFVSSPISYN